MIKIEKWEDLTISNDFLFSKLMRDKEICKEIIEILLNIKVGDITYLEEQKTIDIIYDKKSVRLDVYVEDENKIYNIEMQVTNKKELAKRTRYYQAMIDLNTIEKGETYNKLKESYIIFICTFDPFNKGLSKYSFENICNEDNKIKLNDGTKKIFFNTKEFAKEKNENLKSFLKYINGEKEDNDFINKINEKVIRIKDNNDWRREYMTLEMKLKEIEQEAFEQGIKQGMIKQIKTLKRLNIKMEEIIKIIKEDYNISEEEIKKYL